MTDPWFEERPRGPRVHALVIGVSDYCHRPFGLQPLRSAALSAARVATWLVKGSFRHPEAQLATVRLLLSPHSDEERAGVADQIGWHQGAEPAAATRIEVSNALAAWSADLERDRRNVAVMYVAGHGVQEGLGSLVLLSDAGLNKARPLDEALDIEQVRYALVGPNAPQEQWYFVDACRRPLRLSDEVLRPLEGGVGLSRRYGPPPEHSVCYKAAGAGERAYEIACHEDGGDTTVFGHCLLEALSIGVRYPLTAPGTWVIDAGSLEIFLRSRVQEFAARHGTTQSIEYGGNGDNSRVLTATGRPNALLDLIVVPGEAGAAATVDVYDDEDGARPLTGAAVPVRDAPVPLGHWMLDVHQPPEGAYPSKRTTVLVWPPPRCCSEIPYR